MSEITLSFPCSFSFPFQGHACQYNDFREGGFLTDRLKP